MYTHIANVVTYMKIIIIDNKMFTTAHIIRAYLVYILIMLQKSPPSQYIWFAFYNDGSFITINKLCSILKRNCTYQLGLTYPSNKMRSTLFFIIIINCIIF